MIKSFTSKKLDSCKNYVFYEHNNKHILLKIIFMGVTGCYHSIRDDNKTINFILDDDSLGKIYAIFSHIETKLGFEIPDYTYEYSYATYLKIKVTKDTCFIQNNDGT